MTEPPSDRAPQQIALQQANRIILALAGLVLLLLSALVLFWVHRPMRGLDAAALQDPKIRQQVVTRLAQSNSGFYDSHVDSDLGRTVVSELVDFEAEDIVVSTNRFGMRERDYAMPKPEGTVRIVLLGDSFVFGIGVAAQDRMGVFLEQELVKRSPYDGEIEVLHLGVASWNFINEAAFLRRQLSELRPDVVLQLSLPNDIEDGVGTRGAGVWARFSPQNPERADSVLDAGYPMSVLGFKRPGFVRHGIDWEGQQRYRAAADLLTSLEERIEQQGGEYRLFLNYRSLLRPGWKYLGRFMSEGTMEYVSKDFGNDRSVWVNPSDPHWNAEGHRRFSRVLYEVLRRDALVPQLELPAWNEATEEYEAIGRHGRGEAEQPPLSEDEYLQLLSLEPLASAIDFRQLDDYTAAQVHTGIDPEGMLMPYASFVLDNPAANSSATWLQVTGKTLDRPEIFGATVEIFVDDQLLETLTITAAESFDLRLPIPESLQDRPFLSVRFVADDYFYQGYDYQHCVVLQLDAIALFEDATA